MYKIIERNGGKEEREGTTGSTQVESERRERGGCKKKRDGDKDGRGILWDVQKEKEIERRKER